MTRFIKNTVCSLTVLLFSISATARLYGGVSGGGGHIIHTDSLDQIQNREMIEHMILSSQPELKKYIHTKKLQFDKGVLNTQNKMIYAKLFRKSINGTKTKVSEVLEHTRLIVKENEPCLTPENDFVDGSFSSGEKNSICISAERFSKKVSYPHVKSESVALMLHEIGELAGLSEAEAVLIQSQAVAELSTPVK